MNRKSLYVAMLTALSGHCLSAGVTAAAAAPTAGTNGTVILHLREGREIAGASIWRVYEVWRTDVARLSSGTVTAVDALTPILRRDDKGNLLPYGIGRAGEAICPARLVLGAANPAAGWQQPDFDDSGWPRVRDLQRPTYRSTALSCLRGKFEVTDPRQVTELRLHLAFRGGAVVYMNGREVGRGGMPVGPVAPETLALDYPREAYLRTDGCLIPQPDNFYKVLTYLPAHCATTDAGAAKKHAAGGPANVFLCEEDVRRYQSRLRALDVTIPASRLRAGTNILAVELHRAPADPAMFLAPPPKFKDAGTAGNWFYGLAWSRCELEELTLSAPESPRAVAPNVGPPRGLRVWNHRIDQPLDAWWFGDPSESVRPIRLRGLRNGAYSGMVVASSDAPILGLRAAATELKGQSGGIIPAANVTVGFARTMEKATWDFFGGFDRLDTAPSNRLASIWWYGDVPRAIQPVWVTVKVPRECASGFYFGRLTVAADGAVPTEVPVEIEVVGNWTLPDPQQFGTYVGLVESPETVARYYNVPLWSDAHWRLLDEDFRLLAELGNKEIYLPLVGKSFVDNTDSMVRWLPQADGTYRYDYSLIDKYLAIATRHQKEMRAACLIVANVSHAARRVTRYYTELDPQSGALRQKEAPAWGTPEARAFWKPAIDGVMPVLARYGLEKAALFGIPCDYGDSDGLNKCIGDVTNLFPRVRWLVRTHGQPTVRMDKWWGTPLDVGHWTCMGGNTLDVNWDPDEAWTVPCRAKVANYPTSWIHGFGIPPRYGWRARIYGDKIVPCFSRTKNVDELNTGSPLSRFLICIEGAALTPMARPPGDVTSTGLGSDGGDLWTGFRYADYGSMTVITRWYVGPGVNGPVHTTRSRALQQALQDMEARMFIENAILDPALKRKLGPKLAAQVKTLCDDRTRFFQYLSGPYRAAMRNLVGYCAADTDCTARGLPEGWDDLERRLCLAADEVQRALDRK